MVSIIKVKSNKITWPYQYGEWPLLDQNFWSFILKFYIQNISFASPLCLLENYYLILYIIPNI